MRRTAATVLVTALALGALACGDGAGTTGTESSDRSDAPTPTSLIDPMETPALAPGSSNETQDEAEQGNGTGGGSPDTAEDGTSSNSSTGSSTGDG
jgi:hypothetical protein